VARTPKQSEDDFELNLSLAEKIVGHRFSDRELLRRALTHPSAVEEKDPSLYYERLEFLGDSILGFLIAENLFERFPTMPERAAAVERLLATDIVDRLAAGDRDGARDLIAQYLGTVVPV